MLTLDDMRRLAQAPTHDRRRAEFMGWRFSDVEVTQPGLNVYLRGTFTCVCGRQEYYQFALRLMEVDYLAEGLVEARFDVARRLRELGSFSRDHLLADGYTENQVLLFERLGEQFDNQE